MQDVLSDTASLAQAIEHPTAPVFGPPFDGAWDDLTDEQRAECVRRSRVRRAYAASASWWNARPAAGTIADLLFARFGITAPADARVQVRWSVEQQRMTPALLLPMRAIDDPAPLPSVLAVTFLSAHGSPVGDGRIGWSPEPVAVQFGRAESELIVTRDWRAALAAHVAHGYPATAGLWDSQVRRLRIPDRVKRIFLLAPSRALLEHFRASGREIEIIPPPPDCESWEEAVAHG